MSNTDLAAALNTVMAAVALAQQQQQQQQQPIPGLQIANQPVGNAAGSKRLALADGARTSAHASSSASQPSEVANPFALALRQAMPSGQGQEQPTQQPSILSILAQLPGVSNAMGSVPMGPMGSEEDEAEAEEDEPRREKKKTKKNGPAHRNPTAGGGLSQMRGGGGNGPTRLADFTKVQLDGSEVAINQWTAGDENFCVKDCNPLLEKIIKEGTRRKNQLQSDIVLDHSAAAMMHEIDNYEIVFQGIIALNEAWSQFIKTKNCDLTLVTVQGLHDALNNSAGCQKIWKRGGRIPFWMRERHMRLKILFQLKDGHFEVRTYAILVSGTSCEEAVPKIIIDMMPEEHPQYRPSHQCKPASLRIHWSPALFQMRLIEYSISKMVVYIFKSLDRMQEVFRTMFQSSFPDELSVKDCETTAVEAKEPQSSPGAATRPTVNMESDDFDDIDVDYDQFDQSLIPTEEAQKRQDAKFLISDEAIMNAKVICAIRWPFQFKDFLATAVEKYTAAPPPDWVRAMMGSEPFKAAFVKANQFHKDCSAFLKFYESHQQEWQQFVTLVDSTKDVMDKMNNGPTSDIATVRLISNWSGSAASNLKAFVEIDEIVNDINARFRNPAVQGNLHSTLELRMDKIAGSFSFFCADPQSFVLEQR